MARYEHLPIYKQALELVVFLENTVRNFSRYHKYTVGTRLRELSWEAVTLVVRSNSTPVRQRRAGCGSPCEIAAYHSPAKPASNAYTAVVEWHCSGRLARRVLHRLVGVAAVAAL